ncbi:hypothetical protein D1007_34326 [Hordeum vulgare]|nr:hypothetical protein D1007_34326 [Hordeum vulgare]
MQLSLPLCGRTGRPSAAADSYVGRALASPLAVLATSCRSCRATPSADEVNPPPPPRVLLPPPLLCLLSPFSLSLAGDNHECPRISRVQTKKFNQATPSVVAIMHRQLAEASSSHQDLVELTIARSAVAFNFIGPAGPCPSCSIIPFVSFLSPRSLPSLFLLSLFSSLYVLCS